MTLSNKLSRQLHKKKHNPRETKLGNPPVSYRISLFGVKWKIHLTLTPLMY